MFPNEFPFAEGDLVKIIAEDAPFYGIRGKVMQIQAHLNFSVVVELKDMHQLYPGDKPVRRPAIVTYTRQEIALVNPKPLVISYDSNPFTKEEQAFIGTLLNSLA
jgi:hypothetical protein